MSDFLLLGSTLLVGGTAEAPQQVFNRGPNTAYYKSTSDVSPTNNDGSLVSGGSSTSLTSAVWFYSTNATLSINASSGTIPLPSDQLALVPLLGPTTATRNLINASTATVTPLTLKGATSQSADLFQLQNSSGTAYGGWDSSGRLYTGTPAANTMLAGGAPLHVNAAGSGGIRVTPQGDVLFGTNELIHGGSISTSSASWDYQQSAFDGLYSALNKRWYMRSLIMAEVGDPPDLILGRYGPDNTYPMGLNAGGASLTGVGANTSLGKLSFRGGKVPSGGTVGVTPNAQMSGAVAAVYGRAAETLTDTAQGGRLVFQTCAAGTATVRDVARFKEDGTFELGGNFDTNIYSSTANVLKTDDSFHVTLDFRHLGTNVGFYNHATATQQTVTGSRGGNAALASLLTALAATGLIVDGSS